MFSVSRLEHGMSFVTGGTSTTRNNQWFYNKKVSSSSFSLVATCSSYEDYVDASNWLSGYMTLRSEPTVGDRYGSLRVQIANLNWDASPVVSFDKTGILTSAVRYGDSVNSVVYRISMSFSGASREIDLTGELNSGLFSRPLEEQNPNFRYFYPFTAISRVSSEADAAVYDGWMGRFDGTIEMR
jgi:hypothetical protein